MQICSLVSKTTYLGGYVYTLSPPSTFLHSQLPVNFTENNNFHRGASFSMHLSKLIDNLEIQDASAHSDGHPGGWGSWAQGLMGVNICISAICMWSEKTQGREPITHPRTPEEGVITAAYCFRAHFCTCEAHGNALTPFKLTATDKHQKCKSVLFDASQVMFKMPLRDIVCVRKYPKTLYVKIQLNSHSNNRFDKHYKRMTPTAARRIFVTLHIH